MKIDHIISQHRRDFTALYRCEHCDHTLRSYGYDDDHFHRNVVPAMKCGACGKTAAEDYRPLGTKHAAHEVV